MNDTFWLATVRHDFGEYAFNTYSLHKNSPPNEKEILTSLYLSEPEEETSDGVCFETDSFDGVCFETGSFSVTVSLLSIVEISETQAETLCNLGIIA